ncbi:MAG: SRPBCC family protein [Cytophagaceae bacterium]|nr:MAG: SRPBCC family protein [Cytophagaceae bacterium]
MALGRLLAPSRLRTLLLGLAAGAAYGLLAMWLVNTSHRAVSVSYIFVLPLVLGAIPVLFSSREQLTNYKTYIIWPWLITLTIFCLSFVAGLEGLICLVIITGPFLILGSLGAFLVRLAKLGGQPQTPLYVSLLGLLPLVAGLVEPRFAATDQVYTVTTTREIAAAPAVVWRNVQNVRHIQPQELSPHFVHALGIPRPLDGRLDYAGVGGVRHITWERGLRFRERITRWQPGQGFAYDIEVNTDSIPPGTLDEHVAVGGRYFDVLRGSYALRPLSASRCQVVLTCTYRVTTNLNSYSRLWADFLLNDFNTAILEVVQHRCETPVPLARR